MLKRLGLVVTGGQVPAFLAQQKVEVNGQPENRRGRKLHPGDEIRIGATTYRCVAESGSDRAGT